MVLIPGIVTSLVVYTQFEQKTAITSFLDVLSGVLILTERLVLGCCLFAIVLPCILSNIRNQINALEMYKPPRRKDFYLANFLGGQT